MEDRMKLNDHISVGAQPSEEQLKQMAREGIKSVVNLRTEGEEDQPLSPNEEGEKVRALGMEYLHIPVSSKEPRAEQVDQFRAEVPQLPGPAFVHCASGKRAGSLVLLGTALGAFVHPYFLGLSAFVGAGLVFAGVTDTCGMAMMLARMPWNRARGEGASCSP